MPEVPSSTCSFRMTFISHEDGTNLICQIHSNSNHLCDPSYNWCHNYHPFCVRTTLLIVISIPCQPIHLCIWHRYPHFSTCPIWLFGPRSRLDIFKVHPAIFIFSQTEWRRSFDKGTWKFTMARIYVLPPFPFASYATTASAWFGRSDGAAEYHRSQGPF